MEFLIKSIFQKFDFQEFFITCKWGVMCMTYKTKLYFMLKKQKPKVVNIF